MKNDRGQRGAVVRVAGPVVGAVGLGDVRLYDVVQVGELGLIGEVIRLAGDVTTVQVYEDTSGLRVGEPVRTTGAPLAAQLGPGLLGQIYDGLQRPLPEIVLTSGHFVQRGVITVPLPPDRKWAFTPRVATGEAVGPGDLLGVLPETEVIEHRVMVPPDLGGRVVTIEAGAYTISDIVAVLEDAAGQRHEVRLAQQWPVRRPRPVQTHLEPQEPLVTGTRIIDAFLPVAKGGTAIIPGGFGTGKTVLEHSLARWSDVDIVVYVGCGERGNEMAEVLEEFPRLEDPHTGLPLITRMVLIANTSNMPVAAREASIYTGITIAEYYRDMGYDVLMLADSTSRWGEALREISGRLEEIPGEEGYPAYLGARLSEFYERAGRVICLGSSAADGPGRRVGSTTLVGAVSPPGGDFSEPITQNSMRVAGTFWGLDYNLSRRRHFPAISWTGSYTLYELGHWFAQHVSTEWSDLAHKAMSILQRAGELQEIVQLVGPEALSESERLLMRAADMIRDDFLLQSSYDMVDRFCPLHKTFWMLKALLAFHEQASAALAAGAALAQVVELPIVGRFSRLREVPPEDAAGIIAALIEELEQTFAGLGGR